MIRWTGAGKSSTIKSLCYHDEKDFKSSSKKESCSTETNYRKVIWKDMSIIEKEFMIIDTAGILRKYRSRWKSLQINYFKITIDRTY
jgi:predicted GTPase